MPPVSYVMFTSHWRQELLASLLHLCTFGCSYLRRFYAAAAAGLQSRAAGRQHRVSQVTPRKCQHGVPLVVDDFSPDFGPEVQIADEGDSVQAQRQEE